MLVMGNLNLHVTWIIFLSDIAGLYSVRLSIMLCSLFKKRQLKVIEETDARYGINNTVI